MKSLIKKILSFITGKYTIFKIFCVDIFGWCRSVIIWTFHTIKKPAIFYGFSAWWFAKAFARKRDNHWKMGWDQNGKRQGIIPVDDIKIVVCSRLELKHFQRFGMIKNVVSINGMFKKATYFKSNMNYHGNTKQSS